MKVTFGIAVLFLLMMGSPEAQEEDCLCPEFVKGSQTALATNPGMQLGVQAASNPLDGSYFVGWFTETLVPGSDPQFSVEGKILNSSLEPVSPEIAIMPPQNLPESWYPFIAAVAFHPIRKWHFVILSVPLRDSSGSFYSALRGYIVSAKGTVLARNLLVSTNGPGTRIHFDTTGLLYNSVNKEFLINYTIVSANSSPRTIVQRFNAQGLKVAPYRVFPNAERVRHDFKTNRYLFTDYTLRSNQSEIHAQVVDAHLRKIGNVSTVFSIPYEIQKNTKGPFPVYDSERGQFMIFWSHGPWNNPVLHVRPVASDGRVLNEIKTSLHKPVNAIRYNPITAGYLLQPAYSKVTHLTKDFRVAAEFVFPCGQSLPPGLPGVIFSRANSEFLLTWFHPIGYGKDINVWGRRLSARVTSGMCLK